MADYCGFARSNHFMVKDLEAFKKDLHFAVEANTSELRPGCVWLNETGGQGWPIHDPDDEDEDVGLNWPELFSKHLVPGEIVVLQEVGYERLRYLNGYAVAYDHEGEAVSVGIDDIYKKAAKAFGRPVDEITEAMSC